MSDPNSITIIVVDDDKDIRVNTVDLLSTQYQKIIEFSSPQPALAEIYPHMPAIILTDLRMPGGDGLEFSKAVKSIDPDLPVILMTGYGDITIAVDAMRHGVYDFIEKPVDTNRLLKSIQRAVDKRLLSLSLLETRLQLEQHSSIESRLIGNSPMMKQLKQNVLKLALMDIPVMIFGETGVGKELVARCLHDFSSRRDKSFVALNCAAIPDELAEAELFGYVKGAFTDAKGSRVGKLEHASGGTLFLDEVESLSPSIQAKLLRVLQDGIITPLGSNEESPNAFITPGGHIFVTSGLLNLVNSENALAMVIAHEMAHQIHRHPIKSLGRGMVIGMVAMIFTGIDGSEWASQMLANTFNLGLLAYSRDQELEADQTGLKLLVDYYGHSAGSQYFFSQMMQTREYKQSKLSEYISTHPNTEDRLKYLEQHAINEDAELTPLPDFISQNLSQDHSGLSRQLKKTTQTQ